MPVEPESGDRPGFRLTPIGIVHSCFTEKFGIPRQPGLVTKATATLEMLPPFDRSEMFVGLERFSHVWIHFLFHDTIAEGWRSTVRPPWLGGRKRVGVFASRSPHRPNFLGFSVVRLVAVRKHGKKIFLDLAGIDILDQTPVFDIKPYLPYSDRIDEASGGYALASPNMAQVSFSGQARAFALSYQHESQRDLLALITQVLQQDPRPPSQKEDGREFGMTLWDVNVRWQVRGDAAHVLSCVAVTAG